MKDISVIIVSYNTEALLPEAIGALRRASKALSIETIIVDNASRDNSVAQIKEEHPDCRLIENAANVGFGRANNQALPYISGRYVLLLNADAFVAADTLDKTVAYMDAHATCGILGVRLIGRDGTLQPSCRNFPTPGNVFLQRAELGRFFPAAQLMDDMRWDHASARKCDWVPGCYYLVRRELIDQIGLFDPRYFLYFEEVDHCFAARRAGWEVHFYPDTSVVHIGGESAKSEGEITPAGRQLEALQIESELLYFRKNHGLAAALMDVLLTTLADGILLLKSLLKRRQPLGLSACVRHVVLVWSLFSRTHMGTRPTR